MGQRSERLKVRLPVCPVCLRVGHVPTAGMGGAKVKFACNGGTQNPHKAVKMTPRSFMEVA